MRFIFFLFPFYLFANQNCYNCSKPIDIENWLDGVDKIKKCETLKKSGQAKLINVQANQKVKNEFFNQKYYSPNDNVYALKYLGNKKYEMLFNINFIKTSKSEISPKEMFDHVNNCMKISGRFLKGPNGESLKITILNPEQAKTLKKKKDFWSSLDLRPKQIDIKIIESGNRGNSKNFSSDFTCGVVLHEIFHHAGLSDEYRETSNSSFESDCRPIGPGDSLMAESAIDTYDSVVGNLGSCEIHDKLKSIIDYSNPMALEILMRKGFFHIGNFSNQVIGLPAPEKTAKELFCNSESNVEFAYPKNKNVALTNLISEDEDSITLTTVYQKYPEGDGVIPKARKAKFHCECRPSEKYYDQCKEFLRVFRPQVISVTDSSARLYSCPYQTTRVLTKDYSLVPGSLKIEDEYIHFRSKPSGKISTLFYPAQFLRIINGPCENDETPEIVKKYNACARFSRTHSHHGLGCEEKPAFCDDSKNWLGERL